MTGKCYLNCHNSHLREAYRESMKKTSENDNIKQRYLQKAANIRSMTTNVELLTTAETVVMKPPKRNHGIGRH